MASVNNVNMLQNRMFKKSAIFKTIFKWFATTCIIITIFKYTSTHAIDETDSVTLNTQSTDGVPKIADDNTIEEFTISENDFQDETTAVKPEETDFYSFNVTDITGDPVSLERYRGKVSLVVNVASECGFTDDHYKGLVKLQKSYRGEDFNVLAFPCNQFGAQEPASNYEIERFARTTYRADFPMFAKVNVLNDNVPDAWNYLIEHAGEPPNWNFWKYLVDQRGHLLNAWGPWVSVAEIYDDVKRAIEDGDDTTTVFTEPESNTDPHGGEL
ncbi:glutathione peroxidase 7-like [Ylistrum balloti]|uniref:glutathione peroxidase 7-like n=1 Tax=Ylistrum balloti TaxID=509963 RepID=UPI002905BDD2|nr:glutathione peroxidase 7-like [Ylistrum balloti]